MEHRYESPRAEHEAIQRIWEEVQTKTGVKTGQPAKPLDFIEMILAGIAPGEVNMAINRTQGLAYTVGISDFLSDEQIAAAIAHELGHKVEGFHHTRTAELFADTWAAKQGYGPALLEGLKKFEERASKLHPGQALTDSTHPEPAKRYAAIHKAMRELAAESQEHLNLQEAEAA